jgi:phage anti-repressor protein
MTMSELTFSHEQAVAIYNSGEEFPVDFDLAWVWLNYSNKSNAKRHFIGCNFAKGTDYGIFIKKEENSVAGRPTETIKLSIECLKVWAMMANTPQGRLVRHYFLECEKIAKQKVAESRKPQLPEFTQETVAIYMDGIKYLQDSGDIQLAQLLKSQFGNTLLASQQRNLPCAEPVEQLEGVVDVAIRLGFRVPKNFESPLGKYVKRYCEHLLQGKNNRYSNASAKQIPANMYPAFNAEVERAVTSFCVEKALTNSEIILD